MTNDAEQQLVVPMVHPPDAEELARERAWLTELEGVSPLKRWGAFLRRGGPGYMQSALTLGGGTAAATLIAGGAFGYNLLWVAPLSMLLGVAILSAVAHQTLSTGQRPLQAVRDHAGPFFAWAFVLGAVLASVIWHFAQYALASAALVDIGAVHGHSWPHGATGIGVLAWAVTWAFTYGRSPRLLRWFENSMRWMVWLIVLCFAIVVARMDLGNLGDVLRGFIPSSLPPDFVPKDNPDATIGALGVVVASLAAAVGANMIFLYPYTLLARGWGREHRRLARFDLFAGMFLPYLMVTTLMVVAAAGTFTPNGSLPFPGKGFGPIDAARILEGTAGPVAGRILFDLGLLGMVLSSITLHLVCCGFAATEIFGWKVGSWRFRAACLLPTPGVLGAFLWQDMKIWIALPTTILTGFLLPVVYLGFMRMQRSRAYLGADRPDGIKGALWLGAMGLATAVLSGFLLWKAATALPAWWAAIT
ncbi:MAG: divalent metal cation transporter [Planctomycetota bacterium]|jgi:Mn2+/Fe2+ NRAMP family transporter|nr:divalent metal cation transporter [Planctomycetota bacterium]MDP6839027.1 divalent metal cation transporter [Planctomycetota bacterium]